jgi:hypothetical protein
MPDNEVPATKRRRYLGYRIALIVALISSSASFLWLTPAYQRTFVAGLVTLLLSLGLTMGVATLFDPSLRNLSTQRGRDPVEQVVEYLKLDHEVESRRAELRRLQIDIEDFRQLQALSTDQRQALERVVLVAHNRAKRWFWPQQIALLLIGAILGAIASELLFVFVRSSP